MPHAQLRASYELRNARSMSDFTPRLMRLCQLFSRDLVQSASNGHRGLWRAAGITTSNSGT